jgi:hypothetical protein
MKYFMIIILKTNLEKFSFKLYLKNNIIEDNFF